MRRARFDLFCLVIDNFGDVGVAWRLANDLAARGHPVRLWLDDPSALAWMAPGGAVGVDVIHWTETAAATAAAASIAPGDVVVELFGCEPPAGFIRSMAATTQPPVWINLEYLSAEPYVERSHGLPSPQQSGPGRGLTRWFFYPGFTEHTGGLLREPGLLAERASFDRAAWLAAQHIDLAPGERLVSLFCYDNPALPALIDRLAQTPGLLLLAPGAAQAQVRRLALPPGLRTRDMPWCSQREFDRRLWACDLNVVRGEDSLVRALWAGAPFLWQIYPQHDLAHAAKLDAFLAAFSAAARDTIPSTDRAAVPATDLATISALQRGWNGLQALPHLLPSTAAWRSACTAWRDGLAAQADLVTRLLAFLAPHLERRC